MNGYNFTERMRIALALAREEAARLENDFVSPEHILLGLTARPEGACFKILANLGAILPELRREVEERIGRWPRQHEKGGADLPYSSAARQVLELAMAEAVEMKHTYVGTEHLLLAIARQGTSDAAAVLAENDITPELIRSEIAHVIGVAAAPAKGPDLLVASSPGMSSAIARRVQLAVVLSILALTLAAIALALALGRRQ